eukprot:CAMPEP_0201479900 /NCGR_PEP_ID=MMETSP0151_2-20130828/4528_1 /ASSEMBLY_ACC=CAM_ASM_000257 /TAXON_ID=200890 /ORGANISM="Paramoeba atlantica, Strain 621/1 / CCAP 1560/9" /LENGTH=232 /DNA_ID=CAMNT_0047861611 /DNA_START=6 /DNA_END=702 /DNA_ORIENTATION=+
MKVLSLFALLFLVFFNLTSCHDHDEEEDDHDTDLDDPELQWVTCGSIITLINSETGLRLHSHDVSYGTGSGQQSVTCFDGQSDSNNYWIVRAQHGDYCNPGDRIAQNSIIRLKHKNTGHWLHSHNHRSPLSHEQEVSAFGEEESGDSGDNWNVIFTSPFWSRKSKFRLKHVDTGKFLHSSRNHKFSNPIPGQREVAAVSRRSAENVWTTGEGIFWEANLPNQDGNEKDELKN